MIQHPHLSGCSFGARAGIDLSRSVIGQNTVSNRAEWSAAYSACLYHLRPLSSSPGPLTA